MSLKWADVKTHAESPSELTEIEKTFHYALGPDQLEADGWDATPTQWRRCPPGMDHLTLQNPAVALRVAGRDVVSGGLSYNLDDGGREHPGHSESSPHEPLEPDAVIDNEEELLDMAEALGRDIRAIEKGSLKVHVVSGKNPRGHHDAEDDATVLAGSGADVVLSRRANGQKRKVARA